MTDGPYPYLAAPCSRLAGLGVLFASFAALREIIFARDYFASDW